MVVVLQIIVMIILFAYFGVIMRPSSLGGAAYCVALCLSVCLSVRPVIINERHVAPPSELQWHTCTFPHALRAAYRTAISAAQILVVSLWFNFVFYHFRLSFSVEYSSVYRELLRMRMIGLSLSGDNGQTTGINFKKLGVITIFRFQWVQWR